MVKRHFIKHHKSVPRAVVTGKKTETGRSGGAEESPNLDGVRWPWTSAWRRSAVM